MTPNEKQQSLHTELRQLLKKYNAELWISYEQNIDEGKMVVDFQWDEQMYQTHETGVIPQLNLGTYEDGRGVDLELEAKLKV